MPPDRNSARRVIDKSFLGRDAAGALVRLPETAELLVIGDEQPDGFLEVQYAGRTVRVLVIDLNERSTPIGAAAPASRLSDEQYEDAYREALLLLEQQGHEVGVPYIPDGTRVCSVDGTPYTDEKILDLAWGSTIAENITQAHNR